MSTGSADLAGASNEGREIREASGWLTAVENYRHYVKGWNAALRQAAMAFDGTRRDAILCHLIQQEGPAA